MNVSGVQQSAIQAAAAEPRVRSTTPPAPYNVSGGLPWRLATAAEVVNSASSAQQAKQADDSAMQAQAKAEGDASRARAEALAAERQALVRSQAPTPAPVANAAYAASAPSAA
jgi:hypothetical protein